MKEAGDGSFERTLRAAAWQPWVMKLKSTSEAYNGESRRRHTAVAVERPDYAAECKALLALIRAA